MKYSENILWYSTGCNENDDFPIKYHTNFFEIDENFLVEEKWKEWERKQKKGKT